MISGRGVYRMSDEVYMLMDGKSPEDTVETFLCCLDTLEYMRNKLLKDSDTWKQLIVEAASEPGMPFWTTLLELLVSLEVFWNISFAATATQAGLAATTYARKKKNQIVPAKLKKYVTENCTGPTGMSEKGYWLTDVLASVPPTRELLRAYRGLAPKDKGDAIWKDVPWVELPDELRSFQIIVGNLETFETLFREAWEKLQTGIGNWEFLDVRREDRLRSKIWDELDFLRQLSEEMWPVPPPTNNSGPILGPIKGLGKAKSEMSVLRDYLQCSADVTPNTLTLVAMQRTLMSMSCDAHGHAAGAPAIPSGSI